ncbi:hypothetical protein [uncultured Mycolicibacterium sp.]|uniref:hypothetical protein n=1 Tax=uncultured Mycolicibacterium sp. TaxID=2320817 RepID=UPI00260DB46C|nr:hypothetical protein [uncultured Mycolicibacterium sp.]
MTGSSASGGRARGGAAGALTAALAVAAHGAADGAPPSGAAAVLLALVAASVGALVAAWPRSAHPPVLVVLLGAGQLAGHATLGLVAHARTGPGVPAWVMAAAHVAAVLAGALLITVGDRLAAALSRTVRTLLPPARVPVAPAPPSPPRAADQPLRALLLACSVSHRGPPAVVR